MAQQLIEKPLRQVRSVKELLWTREARDHIGSVLPTNIDPHRFMRVVANSIQATPKLQECEPLGFLSAILTCASLGLEPNTPLGQAYILPFKNSRKGVIEAQVIIGYKGYVALARRSGQVSAIKAGIHYSDDEMWIHEEGTSLCLRHRPGPMKGDKLHAYAIAQLTDGCFAWEVLPWERVMSIRDRSQGWRTAVRYGKQEEHPWHAYEDEMAKKTAVRALAKMLPLSTDFMTATSVDGRRPHYDIDASVAPSAPAAPAINLVFEGEAEPDDVEVSEADDAVTMIKAELQVAASLGDVESIIENARKAAETDPNVAEAMSEIEEFADVRREELA
ncbi:MAG: recombinase RecT [Alphaproteobacteria bacterium]|nr:MAG: recombinase RecT [Alphaproteobacteria bacterium]